MPRIIEQIEVADRPVLAQQGQGVTVSAELIIGVLVSVLVGTVSYLMKRNIDHLDDRMKDHESRLDAIEAGRALLARIEEKVDGLVKLEARVDAIEAGRALLARIEEKVDGLVKLEARLDALETERINYARTEQQFKNLAGSLIRLQEMVQADQKEWMVFRESAGRSYVSREDWVRFTTQIDGKMDALHTRLDRVVGRRDEDHSRE